MAVGGLNKECINILFNNKLIAFLAYVAKKCHAGYAMYALNRIINEVV